MNRIGILIRSENNELENDYYEKAIKKFGGKITFIYDTESFSSVSKKMANLDGILLSGGDDVGRLDFFIIQYVLEHNLKLLGICQGMQSMALYGTNNKLINIGDSHYDFSNYSHKVYIDDSCFRDIIKKDEILVNSHHRQTVKDSRFFRVVGRSEDNLIEVVENSNHSFQIGVQWHPERMLEYDEVSNVIIEKFVNMQ